MSIRLLSQSGLRLSKGSLTTVNAAIVGTIQHALLEQSIQTWGKDYAKLNETEMAAILSRISSSSTICFLTNRPKLIRSSGACS